MPKAVQERGSYWWCKILLHHHDIWYLQLLWCHVWWNVKLAAELVFESLFEWLFCWIFLLLWQLWWWFWPRRAALRLPMRHHYSHSGAARIEGRTAAVSDQSNVTSWEKCYYCYLAVMCNPWSYYRRRVVPAIYFFWLYTVHFWQMKMKWNHKASLVWHPLSNYS